jgi:hypothetical protein
MCGRGRNGAILPEHPLPVKEYCSWRKPHKPFPPHGLKLQRLYGLFCIVQHAPCDLATIDAEIATLGNNLAALQDMARSLPIGVTVPIDKRAEFCQMVALVDYLFERLAVMLESTGVEPEIVVS